MQRGGKQRPGQECKVQHTHLLKVVNEVHKLAISGDNWVVCEKALMIMKEGTADEMEQYITECLGKEGSKGWKARVSVIMLSSNSCVSVLKVGPICFIKSLNRRLGVGELRCLKPQKRMLNICQE